MAAIGDNLRCFGCTYFMGLYFDFFSTDVRNVSFLHSDKAPAEIVLLVSALVCFCSDNRTANPIVFSSANKIVCLRLRTRWTWSRSGGSTTSPTSSRASASSRRRTRIVFSGSKPELNLFCYGWLQLWFLGVKLSLTGLNGSPLSLYHLTTR